ncbi:unnamed protein product [Lymnaea stagnalis]|uniref:Sialin n=1 Tax=Lymnaea stagnalis TaxID=6523 RepID=A0AAV2IR47_LYMST
MVPNQKLQNVLTESLDASVSIECQLNGKRYINRAGYDSHGSESEQLLGDQYSGTIFKENCCSKPTCYVPARYVLALWSFLGFINMFTLRMDMNIAILAMVENCSSKVQFEHTSTEATIVNATHYHPNKFHWSEKQQDLVLGAFFYGYCSTQILGGYLSGKLGAKLILGLGILMTSILSLLTPIASEQSIYLLVACRIMQGLAQGLAQPCMHTMWSKWAPDKEKSWLMTITYAGCQVGTVVATWATGYMAESDILGGWPFVFYFFGGFGALWSILWLSLVHDTPRQHPRISTEEREYIEANLTSCAQTQSRLQPRWTRVLSSPAFLAIVAAHFANDWGCFALTTCLPSYLHHILGYEIKQNGFLSSLPFLILVVTNPLSGYLADFLRAKRNISTKNTRKLVNSIGLFVPSVLMFSVCYVGSDRNIVVALLTLAVGFSGFTMAGYSVNHLDIAPSFAGILYGITNTVGTTTGFIGPAILATLTDGENNKHQWMIFFYITSGIFFVGGLTFLLFAEGEPQDWRMPAVEIIVQPPLPITYEDSEHTPDINTMSVQTHSSDTDSPSDSDSDKEWEELISHRRSRRTAPVHSLLCNLQSY